MPGKFRPARHAVAALLLLMALPLAPLYANPPIHAEQSLPLWGKLQKDIMRPLARAAALLKALDQAESALKAHTMVNIGLEDRLQRQALALAVYDPSFSEEITAAEHIKVTAALRPTAEGLDKALPRVMGDYNEYVWRKAALAFAAPRCAEALDLARRAFNSRSEQAFYERIDFLSAQMAAWLLLNEAWRADVGPREGMRVLRKALAIDRHNPVIWAAAGEKLLLLDQPLEAIKSLDEALALQPGLAPALHLRGLAHMRLHQLALAESDLSQALKLEPGHAEWLRARGAVRMLKNDHKPMCEDFFAACSLGDCEGLALARKKKLCLK